VDEVGRTRLARAAAEAALVRVDTERAGRWVAEGLGAEVVVRFELLADLDDVAEGATLTFDGCEALGAANLRGTGYAVRDVQVRELHSKIGGAMHSAEVNLTGLAGFLLAKIAAARSRRKPKDWYDIGFVLLRSDVGGRRKQRRNRPHGPASPRETSR